MSGGAEALKEGLPLPTLKGHAAWKRWTMGVLLLFGFALAMGYLLVPRSGRAAGVAEGALPPDFTLSTLDGKPVTLSQLRGKVVLVNFWATWCPPCRQEMPALVAAYKQFAGPNVAFVAVNLQENPVTVAAFAEQYGVTFPIALDAGGKVTEQYSIIPLPTSFFIGRDGKVAFKVEQPMDQAAIAGRLTALLSRP